MNQQEQKWLVLLYSLMELDGGSQRKNVLRHIQENGYWHKNDKNDISRTTRNEKAWRNDFSYERQHLVEQLLQMEDTEDAGEDALAPLSDEPIPKGPVSNRSGNKNTYLRDPAVARRALARAGHCCEVDKEHVSFLRRNGLHKYMEPHHLIPMSWTDEFGVSLDREQNIFSLCSNCHNQIHYGTKEDVRTLVTRLFHSREQEICSILGKSITQEELYQIYKVL